MSAIVSAARTVRDSAALVFVALGTTIFVVCPGNTSIKSESVAARLTLNAPAAVSAVAPELRSHEFPALGAGVRLKPGFPAMVKAHTVSGALPTVVLTLVATGCGVFKSGAAGLP